MSSRNWAFWMHERLVLLEREWENVQHLLADLNARLEEVEKGDK